MLDMRQFPADIDPATFTQAGSQYDQVLWDRIILLDTVDNHSFFSVGQGENFPGTTTKKTRADTNLKGRGIASSKSFWILGYVFKYYGVDLKTVAELLLIDDLMRNTVWDFKLNNNQVYGSGTLDFILGEAKQIQLSLAAGSNYQYKNYGVTKGFYPLNAPIPMANLVDFNIELDMVSGSNAALNADQLYWGMVGIENKLGL